MTNGVFRGDRKPMILDTSAIVAILRDEPDAWRFQDALAHAIAPRLSAGTYLESAVVVDMNGDPVLSARFDALLDTIGAKVEPVTWEQVTIARRAYREYGKGSGHPAKLNFGDCFAYALVRDTGEALLFKGSDFSCTDVQAVLNR